MLVFKILLGALANLKLRLVSMRDAVQFFFGGKYFIGDPVCLIAKIVVRGNALQIFSNFPAKSLSIQREHFLLTPFN